MDVTRSTRNERWWIDFLEFMESEDQASRESFCLLRQWFKESDPIEGWPLDERLERMRERIMRAVEAESSVAHVSRSTTKR